MTAVDLGASRDWNESYSQLKRARKAYRKAQKKRHAASEEVDEAIRKTSASRITGGAAGHDAIAKERDATERELDALTEYHAALLVWQGFIRAGQPLPYPGT